VEPKIFAPLQTPFPRVQDGEKFNQLEMVTTFTYRPSLPQRNSLHILKHVTNESKHYSHHGANGNDKSKGE